MTVHICNGHSRSLFVFFVDHSCPDDRCGCLHGEPCGLKCHLLLLHCRHAAHERSRGHLHCHLHRLDNLDCPICAPRLSSMACGASRSAPVRIQSNSGRVAMKGRHSALLLSPAGLGLRIADIILRLALPGTFALKVPSSASLSPQIIRHTCTE